MKLTDTDQDGKISRAEFHVGAQKHDPEYVHAKADKKFDQADANKDGFLDMEGMLNC